VGLKPEFSVSVSEDKVLRKTFGTNWEQMAGAFRKLHSEQHHNLYLSPLLYYHHQISLDDQTKERQPGMKCSTCGEKKLHKKFLLKDLRWRDHLEDLGIDVKIILKLIIKK
jgi:hypothetical protein